MENLNKNADERFLLHVASSPHVRNTDSTQRIMLDVIIALIPAMIAAIVFFGIRSLAVILVSVAACVLSEYATQKIMKKTIRISDLSAVVTGILLAFNVPSTMPFWMVAFAGFFAIVVVKEFFGGIGCNFLNPALAGRAMLLSSWGAKMSQTVAPFQPDTLSGATPLSGGAMPSLMDMFIGKMPGMLGEVSSVALLIGAAYLVVRGVIHLRIPAAYLGSFIVCIAIFGMISGDMGIGEIPQQLLAGGLILGAFFMATDYATTPMTPQGQIIFGIGCGLLTALIRVFGGYPEGVSYAILIMNVCTPLIDKYIKLQPFGGGK